MIYFALMSFLAFLFFGYLLVKVYKLWEETKALHKSNEELKQKLADKETIEQMKEMTRDAFEKMKENAFERVKGQWK